MRNYGFQLGEKDPKAYVFGASALTQDVLVEDGQWDKYLPPDEFQDFGNFEPYACASFGTLNCIETILTRRYSETNNYSDRYLAFKTDTAKKMGNSPHYVAEWLRLSGDVFEKDWPFSSDITTFEEFYKEPPQIKDKLLSEFSFGHEYIKNTAEDKKAALRLSPLGLSVYGWMLDEDGLYFKSDGLSDNHWVMCYGYVEGKYWKVFDSYSNSHKKLKWDYSHDMIKRYHIDRTAVSQQQLGLFAQILKAIQLFLAKLNT